MPRTRSRSSRFAPSAWWIASSIRSARRAAVGGCFLGEREGEERVDEPLLGSVVEVALQPAAGLVGGRHDARARGGEVRLVFGACDRGGGELCELHEALLGADGQWGSGGARRQGAPDASFNGHGHDDSRSHAEFLRDIG